MKKLIILIIPLLFSLGLSGQDENHNAITLNWGMGKIKRQDLTVSPFIHKEWSPVNIMLSFSRTKKFNHLLEFKYSSYNPGIIEPYDFKTFYNGEERGLDHSFTLIDLNYALGKSIIDKKDRSFVIGGKSRNLIYASDYNFGTVGPSPMYISFGLDIWLNAEYNLNEKHYFKSNLSLPIFSYIYRAPYLAWTDEYFENISSHKGLKEFASRIEDGHFQSWASSQRFDFDLSYAYVLNKNWDLGICYLLSNNFNQTPTSFSQIESGIYLNANFKF